MKTFAYFALAATLSVLAFNIGGKPALANGVSTALSPAMTAQPSEALPAAWHGGWGHGGWGRGGWGWRRGWGWAPFWGLGLAAAPYSYGWYGPACHLRCGPYRCWRVCW